MRKFLIGLVCCAVSNAACSERARGRTVVYPRAPSPAALHPVPPPAPSSPPPVATARWMPAASEWCLPSAGVPQLPGFDLSPFAAAIGLEPCGQSSHSGDAADDEPLLVPLPVPGHGAAVVSLPRGAPRPQPVIVALHGSHDRPEWQCADMRALIGNRGVVLCPRGVEKHSQKPSDDTRYTYGGDTVAEVDAAVTSLRVMYGLFVDPGPMIYAGFSLGATLGPNIVLADSARYPRLLLIEGGTSGWNTRKFARDGGQRVLFGCGLSGCVASASAVGASFERHGVSSRVAYGHDGGHHRGGPVADAIKASFGWLIEGDPRWQQ